MPRNGGKWTRWGRGSCEGYSLSLGNARDLRGDVIRNIGPVPTWRASVGAYGAKEFPSREAAMAHVEQEIRQAMAIVLEDWNTYGAARSLARIGVAR